MHQPEGKETPIERPVISIKRAYYLYICDVEQVYGNEGEKALFAWNGYAQIRPAE